MRVTRGARCRPTPTGRPGRSVRAARDRGQAVIEMAIVLPLCLVLLTGYLVIMVLVQTESAVHAAIEVAAQSAIQAPSGDYQDGCTYAFQSFYSTLYQGTGTAPATSGMQCSVGAQPYQANGVQLVSFQCPNDIYLSNINQYDAAAKANTFTPLTCSATIRVDFRRTVLGWAVPLTATLSASAVSVPTTVRQS